MATQTIPTVNGYRYSWASIQIDAGSEHGGIQAGVAEISYRRTTENTKLMAPGSPKPIGRTRARSDYEGSLTMYKEDFRNLIQTLGDGWGDVVIPVISVSYSDEDNPVTTDELKSVILGDIEDNHSDGTDALRVTVGLDILDIKFDGLETHS